MKNKLTILGLVIIYLISILTNVYPQSPKRFSKEEIKSDFKYLHNSLESAHYNLYAYTGKEVFDSLSRKIDSSINDSLTTLQVYRLFQPYVALSKMGHCMMDYPWGDYFGSYLNQGGTVFPLNLFFSKNRLYIKNNFSDNFQISVGDELMILNGKPIKKFMEDIYDFLSGESNYYKNSIVESITFTRLFWFSFGRCDTFDLKIKKPNGKEIILEIPAISGWAFENKSGQQNPMSTVKREFRFMKDIAYLLPGSFFNPSNEYFGQKTFDNKVFLHFLDSCFTEIHKRNSKFLIIDLRDNPGGMSSFSIPLVTYFASKPFIPAVKITYKTSQITKDGLRDINDSLLAPSDLKLKADLLSHDNSSVFEEKRKDQSFPKNDSLKFKGKVYVLVNRFTYSEAIEISALIQDYKFGTIVGEITPNAATMYASTQQFKLPNTQLSVQYPRALLKQKRKKASLVGVIPSYKIEDNPLTDQDEILDYTVELIKGGK